MGSQRVRHNWATELNCLLHPCFSLLQNFEVKADDLEPIVELGRGAYGVVEKMRHVPSEQIMAVKVAFTFPRYFPVLVHMFVPPSCKWATFIKVIQSSVGWDRKACLWWTIFPSKYVKNASSLWVSAAGFFWAAESYPLFLIALCNHHIVLVFAMPEMWVRSLGWENPLENEMATDASILAWRIPWTEECGGLQSMGSQRVGHD